MARDKKKYTYIRKKGIISHFFSLSTLIVVLFVLLLVGGVLFLLYLSEYFIYFFAVSYLLTAISLTFLSFKESTPAFRIIWSVIVAIIPIGGPLIYFISIIDTYPRSMAKKYKAQMKKTKELQDYQPMHLDLLNNIDPRYTGLAKYLGNSSSFPLYINNEMKYIETGEKSFEALLREIGKAKKYILLEFFIIKDGYMWQEVVSALARKVEEGVDVKILYDGINDMYNLPRNYPKRLKKIGLDVRVFARPMTPLVNRENYRNHKKCVVIDGKVGYVGGMNIADEYINRIERFGHWKDCVLEIKGSAVNSIMLSFFSMWNQSGSQTDTKVYLSDENEVYNVENFLIPFADSPFDEEHISKNVYLEIINKAVDYVYISTPYLVLEQQFIEALTMAAKRGVVIKILLPHIPDKIYVKLAGEAHYKTLINAGVKIFEYTKGFNHSKLSVSDDVAFVVGSINLDYRSFYLNYENGVFGYENLTALAIKQDLEKDYSEGKEITMKEYKKINIFRKLLSLIFRIFSPML